MADAIDKMLTQEGLDVLEAALRSKQRGPTGDIHDLYSWRPGTPEYAEEDTSTRYREGNLTFQRDVLTCEADTIGVVTSNGVGKTTLGARYTAARFRRHDPLTGRSWDTPQRIWVCCPPDMIQKIFKEILRFIPKDEIEEVHRARGSERIVHKNGSMLEMKSTHKDPEEFQSENLNFVWCDEEPRQAIWIELSMRLRMPDSQMLLTFTPVQGTKFMHAELDFKNRDQYEGAQDGVLSLFFAKMEDSPYLTDAAIERAKKICEKDEDAYAIRIMGEYRLMGGRHFFADSSHEQEMADIRDACIDPKHFYSWSYKREPSRYEEESNGDWAIFKEPETGRMYVLVLDLSKGTEDGDWTAGHILDTTNGEQVARYQAKVNAADVAISCYWAGMFYNCAWINWEDNYDGTAFYYQLRDLGYPNLMRRQKMGSRITTITNEFGFRTHAANKHQICNDLRLALYNGEITVRDRLTVDELMNFGRVSKKNASSGSYNLEALEGHDDLVMSLAIAWWTLRQVAPMSSNLRAPDKSIPEQMLEEAIANANRSRQRKRGRVKGRLLMPRNRAS